MHQEQSPERQTGQYIPNGEWPRQHFGIEPSEMADANVLENIIKQMESGDLHDKMCFGCSVAVELENRKIPSRFTVKNNRDISLIVHELRKNKGSVKSIDVDFTGKNVAGMDEAAIFPQNLS